MALGRRIPSGSVSSPPVSSHRAIAEIGRELGGRYRLVAPIGVGTSSRVFLAVDTQLRRRVAVKLLHAALAADDTFLRRFRAEARAAGALNHPNIVAVYDWGEDETDEGMQPYLVTEYLGGGSLRRILDRGRPLSPSQALMVGLDTARALAHAHRRGLVHRDVKPGNLLFDTDGRLRLADFGVARALAEAAWTEPSGTMLGTARYASPEQAMGRRLDGRSDVYSLALVLIECVTSRVPFAADTTTGTLALRTQGDLEVPDDLAGLRGTLERAGRLDPEQRPDAAEVEISLLAAAESMPRPEPLPLVATLDEAQITAELRLVEGIDGLGVVTALDADELPVPEDPVTGRSEVVDRTVDEPEVLERTPIVVAEEHHLLATSRPASFGRVEPFVADARVGDDPAADPGVAPVGPVPHARRRRRAPRLLLGVVAAVAVLGAAAAWWFLIRVPVHDVPDLVGRPLAEVSALARQNGWKLDDDTVVRADDTRPGQVVEQSPRSGSTLSEGDTLHVTVSLGPTLVAVPDLRGVPEAEARAQIEAAGLTAGASSTTTDEEVPSGAVVSAGPAPGQEAPASDGTVPRGTELALVVSSGPAPRVVPDGLVGLSAADAKARLAAVQLGASVTEVNDEVAPAGMVMAVGTPPGTSVPRDTAVGLTVSKGPAPIPVPNVVGLAGTAASAQIQAVGLGVSGIEGSPSNAVLATDPPAGEAIPRGAPVRIFTRR
ncbi:MAG: serine/threonine-protein kinase [Acidimicrobiia bacterium]|nr:MAG: serine/threonine-protein kinase [Acidimicrobiia bacterium]